MPERLKSAGTERYTSRNFDASRLKAVFIGWGRFGAHGLPNVDFDEFSRWTEGSDGHFTRDVEFTVSREGVRKDLEIVLNLAEGNPVILFNPNLIEIDPARETVLFQQDGRTPKHGSIMISRTDGVLHAVPPMLRR